MQLIKGNIHKDHRGIVNELILKSKKLQQHRPTRCGRHETIAAQTPDDPPRHPQRHGNLTIP